MELETVRVVADWLANTTSPGNGINPLLSSVPLDSGDSAPPPVTVYDATRDSWVARRMLPNDATFSLPAVAVFLLQAATLEAEVAQDHRDGTFSVAVAYLFERSDSRSAMQSALYTKRAIMRSLKQLHAPVNVTARQRNSVHVYVCTGMTLDPTVADWQRSGSAWLATAVLLQYKVRDLAP